MDTYEVCKPEECGRTWTYTALDSKVLCVALKGEFGDWCAYIGAVEGRSHVKEASEVVKSGSKLPYWIAKRLFSSMDEAYAWRE